MGLHPSAHHYLAALVLLGVLASSADRFAMAAPSPEVVEKEEGGSPGGPRAAGEVYYDPFAWSSFQLPSRSRRASSFYVPQVDIDGGVGGRSGSGGSGAGGRRRRDLCTVRSLAALLPKALYMKRLAANKRSSEEPSGPITQTLKDIERRLLFCNRMNQASKVRLV